MPSGEPFPSLFDLSTPFHQPRAPSELNKNGESQLRKKVQLPNCAGRAPGWLLSIGQEEISDLFLGMNAGYRACEGHVILESLETLWRMQLQTRGGETDNTAFPGGLCM